MTNNKKQKLSNAANITSISNKRVEKNLKALKLLQEHDVNISDSETRAILNEYNGWGGLFVMQSTPHVFIKS